ncbi:hypothetical protein GCM10011393_09980 [Sphingopyxis bauzanensis]|nr:hypothetical protein GCM10011393_09980 [Sphingopyxis bauzanensis]
MTRGRGRKRALPVVREGIASAHIAGLTVAAHEDFFPVALGKAAADLARPAPDQLGIMRNILRAARAAVAGKDAGNEIFFLGDPQINHRFRAERAWCATPDILALERAPGDIGRMLEAPRRGKMICPGLRTLREIAVPAQRRHAGERTLAVMAVEQPVVDGAEARLRAGEHGRCQREKSDLSCRFAKPRHSASPRSGDALLPNGLRRGGRIWLISD